MTSLTFKARQLFQGDRYATDTTGVVLDTLETGHACCSLTLVPAHRNAMGAVMGGVMFTLADFAFAAAANASLIADDAPLAWVSLTSSINYLSQPKGCRLTAEATCVKQGRTTCLYNILIRDDQSNAVAMVATTGMKTK